MKLYGIFRVFKNGDLSLMTVETGNPFKFRAHSALIFEDEYDAITYAKLNVSVEYTVLPLDIKVNP